MALVCILCGSVAALASPVDVTDDVGREVRLPAPAHRIVSLAPHLTEILFALGVGDRVVGTVKYADYPAAASEVPRLGDAFSVSVESVLALKPDIVFAWRTGGSRRAITRLAALGIPVYYSEAPRIEAIATSVEKIALLVGRPKAGKALASAFNASLQKDQQAAKPGRIKVFFQISDQGLYTVNNQHLIGQAISLCGGENIFGRVRAAVPQVSKEAVIAGRPDLIVITRSPGHPPSAWAKTWQEYPAFKGRVRFIDPDLISRPGLRMAKGVGRLCKLIRQAESALTPGAKNQ